MKCPCSPVCTKRNTYCHSECKEYRQYESEKKKEYAEKQKQRDYDGFFYEDMNRKTRILNKH